MGQDSKISQLDSKALTSESSMTGYIVISEDNKNYKISLAQLRDLIGSMINSRANTIANVIANDDIAIANIAAKLGSQYGGGGSSDISSADFNTLKGRVDALDALTMELASPANYPTTYIRLISGEGEYTTHSIQSGYGVTSDYTYEHPLDIQVQSVQLPNFYVTLTGALYNRSYNIQITANQNGISLEGGTVGTVIITGTMNTSNGMYDISPVTISKWNNTVLNASSNPLEDSGSLTTQVSLPSGTSVYSISITCSVAGKGIGDYANINSSNSGVAHGQIKL